MGFAENFLPFAAPAADTALNMAVGAADMGLRLMASDSMGKEGAKQAEFMRSDVYPRYEEYGRAMESGAQNARTEFENYRNNLGPTAEQRLWAPVEQIRNTWQASNKSMGDAQEQAYASGNEANRGMLEEGRKRYEEGTAALDKGIDRAEELRTSLLDTTRADLDATFKAIKDQVAVRLSDTAASNEGAFKNSMASIDEAVKGGQMTPAEAQTRKMQAAVANRQQVGEASRKLVADHSDMVRTTHLAGAQLMEKAGADAGKWVADAYTTKATVGAQDRATAATIEQNFVRNDMDINMARMQSEQYRAERGQAVETGIAEATMNAFSSDRGFFKNLADMAQGVVATETALRSTAATTLASMLQSYHSNQFAMETAGAAALLGSSPLLNVPDMGSPFSTGFVNQQAIAANNQSQDTNDWFGPLMSVGTLGVMGYDAAT